MSARPECSCLHLRSVVPARFWLRLEKLSAKRDPARMNGVCAASTSHRHKRLRVQAIGFDLSGELPTKSVEKRAAELYRDACSLLLFQPVLEGKTAKAFLKVLLNLQRRSIEDALSSYGEFYRELAQSQSKSWQDFLLDEILSGRNNAWAKAVANGEQNPASAAAVEHDLNILMRLALGDRTLASMVKEAHPNIPEAWLTAASAICPAAIASDELPRPSTGQNSSESSASDHSFNTIQGPPSAEEREEWRAKIAGQWRWGQAASDLQLFFQRHGAGLTQRYSILEWKNDALQAFSPFHPGNPGDRDATEGETSAPGYEESASAILELVQDHLFSKRRSLAAILFSACPKQSWRLCVNEPYWAQGAAGLRIVVAPLSVISKGAVAAHSLARALSQHKRMRFLVVSGLDESAEPRSELSAHSEAIFGALAGHVGVWPANALPLIAQYKKDEERLRVSIL